jgi:SAM-dependent methyltransferase
MPTIFEWKQSEFGKLIANCPDEPVSPFIHRYFKPGARLLEAGCGSGRFVYWLTEKGYDIEGLEISPTTVETLNKLYPSLKITQGDVCQLPYPDNSFDGILSLGVIEHVFAGMTVPIQEMYRVLKPGGVALVIVPSYNRVRQVKWLFGIYHVHALIGVVKGWNFVRRIFGKAAREPDRNAGLKTTCRYRRWPAFGEFYEFRLRKREFETALTQGGFIVVESVPTSLLDGIYHEFGPWFVKLRDHTFYPNIVGRKLNALLGGFPFTHNHMHLCVVRK